MTTSIAATHGTRAMRLAATATLLLALLLSATPARAATMGFEAVEGLFPESSISMDVTSAGNAATFTLRNSGVGAITAIYFDWGSLDNLFGDPAAIDDSLDGVSYTDDQGNWFRASPRNMPGANGMDNPFQADFSLGPEHRGGVPHNGIGLGEYLSITWELVGLSFEQLLDALNTGDVRVGMHVQSLADGSSATGVSATPIPGAAWLLGSALAGLLVLQRVRGSSPS